MGRTPDFTDARVSKRLAELDTYLQENAVRLAKFHPDNDRNAASQLCRIARTAATHDDDLLFCNLRTMFLSLVHCARWGLMPGVVGGIAADAYLVTFKGICSVMPSYRGLTKLVRQSGEVHLIRAHVVYEADLPTFEIHQGTEPRVLHQISLATDRGAPVGAYAIARMTDSGLDDEVEWVPWEEVMLARKSAAAKSGAWINWPGQMARKVAIKRICNQLPVSPAARSAIALDHSVAAEDADQTRQVLSVDGDGNVIDVGEMSDADLPRQSKSAASMKDRVRARAQKAQEEDDVPNFDALGMVVCTACGRPVAAEAIDKRTGRCEACGDDT